MNAEHSIIEPNRQVDCMVIRRSLMAVQLTGHPVTAELIRLAIRRV
jgi:hypothetical protein